MKHILMAFFILMMTLTVTAPDAARAKENLSTGQTVYVPAYSHIYSGNKEVQSLLAVTLSIRNTDPNHPIEILSVDYYDTEGKRIKKHIAAPVTLNALGTARYVISQGDKSGGSGANFMVRWKAGKPVNLPIIETIMIGSRSSFTSRGQEIFPSR
ncbi:MAG: DUF3124 domain-containing protein [Desulfobacter sp.]|nr:MAG: DUF3124 domain-containing protein [Desulfobacter sp.]